MHVTLVAWASWALLSLLATGHSLALLAFDPWFGWALLALAFAHEAAHVVVARRLGVAVSEIVLLPFGGALRFAHPPVEPRHELRIALAGPLAHAAAVLPFAVAVALADRPSTFGAAVVHDASVSARLLRVSLVLVGLHLLPALPLDGGRALRALLARHMPAARATRATVAVGDAVAAALTFVGFFTSPWLILLALVLWLAGRDVAEHSEGPAPLALRGPSEAHPARPARR